MTRYETPSLVRLDPNRIIIDPDYVKASERDTYFVQEDLNAYVSWTRAAIDSPTIRIIDGEIYVITGAPFLRAVQVATPPIREVVCTIYNDHELRSLGLVEVSPTELIDATEGCEPAPQMVTFCQTVDSQQRSQVIDELNNATLAERLTEENGSDDSSAIEFVWEKDYQRLSWSRTWRDASVQQIRANLTALLRIHDHLTPIRSLNGLRLDYYRRYHEDVE